MPIEHTFDSFEKELNRLVESFGKRIVELKQPGYAEAQLRDDFLNPFFRALGWDMENRAGLIQREREVKIESATQIGGGRKRADYLLRTDKLRAATSESEKAVLQNAVTATDQQIDALVYELYGLTDDEIKLVES
jgi:hypothetical protein